MFCTIFNFQTRSRHQHKSSLLFYTVHLYMMDSQLCIFTLFLWNLGYQESHRTYFFVLFLFPFLCSSCNITLIISTVKG